MRSAVRLLALPLLLACLVLVAPTARALVMKAFTLSELVERSDVVVVARVGTSAAHLDEARNRIYTTWSLEVTEPVFGAKRGDKLAVRLMGGVVGELSMSISGNPELETGEEVFLFLKSGKGNPMADEGMHYISGMSQGKYTVVRGDGEARLFRGAAGNEYGLAPDALRLDEMKARVIKLRAPVTSAGEVK